MGAWFQRDINAATLRCSASHVQRTGFRMRTPVARRMCKRNELACPVENGAANRRIGTCPAFRLSGGRQGKAHPASVLIQIKYGL
jgi:hypothetical protein